MYIEHCTILGHFAVYSPRLRASLGWFAVFALGLILLGVDTSSGISVWVLVPSQAGDFGNLDTAIMPEQELSSLGSMALRRKAEHHVFT